MEPPYGSLKCEKCGNTQFFVEDAFRPTTQRFTQVAGEDKTSADMEWEEFEVVDDHIPAEQIRCNALVRVDGPGTTKDEEVCGKVVWKNPDFILKD